MPPVPGSFLFRVWVSPEEYTHPEVARQAIQAMLGSTVDTRSYVSLQVLSGIPINF